MSRLRFLLRMLVVEAESRASPTPPGRRLNVCLICRRDMVVPVRWDEDSDRTWWIRLRCGACGFVRETVVDDESADALDRVLHRQTQEIAAELRRLER